jgi:hypothetical protein
MAVVFMPLWGYGQVDEAMSALEQQIDDASTALVRMHDQHYLYTMKSYVYDTTHMVYASQPDKQIALEALVQLGDAIDAVDIDQVRSLYDRYYDRFDRQFHDFFIANDYEPDWMVDQLAILHGFEQVVYTYKLYRNFNGDDENFFDFFISKNKASWSYDFLQDTSWRSDWFYEKKDLLAYYNAPLNASGISWYNFFWEELRPFLVENLYKATFAPANAQNFEFEVFRTYGYFILDRPDPRVEAYFLEHLDDMFESYMIYRVMTFMATAESVPLYEKTARFIIEGDYLPADYAEDHRPQDLRFLVHEDVDDEIVARMVEIATEYYKTDVQDIAAELINFTSIDRIEQLDDEIDLDTRNTAIEMIVDAYMDWPGYKTQWGLEAYLKGIDMQRLREALADRPSLYQQAIELLASKSLKN